MWRPTAEPIHLLSPAPSLFPRSLSFNMEFVVAQQEEMAEQLHITSRAYGDLERGRYCFSAAPLLFLLLMLSDRELAAFLGGFRERARA